MKKEPQKEEKLNYMDYEITDKGSLGLLALGDVGLRAWRKVKQEFHRKESE